MDISEITCYNCNKKRHYSDKCPEPQKSKKLVTVLAISMPVTVVKKGAVEDGKNLRSTFAQVLCIWYPDTSRKKSVPMSSLFDSGSKVNAIHPTFAKELRLLIRPINVKAQKIDGITLNTYEIVVAAFSINDKANQVRFFEKTFLIANISPEVVFGILFLILSGGNIHFLGWKL